MKIAFSPAENVENKYISNIKKAIASSDSVELTSFRIKNVFLFKKEFFNYDYVWLNWYEDHNGILHGLIKILTLYILRIKKIKIVYVFHNKKSHNVKSPFIYKWLFKILMHFSYRIIIHSKSSYDELPSNCNEKIVYVPHPNYIEDYGPILEESSMFENRLDLLFIGQIKLYKNIELLIDVIKEFDKEDVFLTICGKAESEHYKAVLSEKAKDIPNVKLDFKFIPDNEINGILSKTDLLILPYNLESSLNSGTIIMAFSYKKSVIAPNIGTLKDMKTKKFYTYEYFSELEHSTNLSSQVCKAIMDKKKNRSIFKSYGKALYEEMETYYSLSEISKIINKNILGLT